MLNLDFSTPLKYQTPRVNLTGQSIGFLTVLEESFRIIRYERRWLCKCVCGAIISLPQNKLTQRRQVSCGCKRTKHGQRKSPAYSSWTSMLHRCRNPQAHNYQYYGGRNITVCNRWFNFQNFLDDMGQPPSNSTLDRIDNNGNYEPDNCRWATPLEQARNRRNSYKILFKEQLKSVGEWAIIFGLGTSTIKSRIRRNWSIEEALTTPSNCRRNLRSIRARAA